MMPWQKPWKPNEHQTEHTITITTRRNKRHGTTDYLMACSCGAQPVSCDYYLIEHVVMTHIDEHTATSQR